MKTPEQILKENGIGTHEIEPSEGFKRCLKAMELYANSKLDEAGRRVDESNSDYYVVTSANIISLKDKI